MDNKIVLNNPKQKLLFFVAQEVDNNICLRIRDFVHRLAFLRHWLNGPPQYVNVKEDPKDLTCSDMTIHTIGGYLEIFSALPPYTLPREIDLQHLDEVSSLVNELCIFSCEHKLIFEFELDGTYVGSVTYGKMDRSLSEGLLGEWRRQLGQ